MIKDRLFQDDHYYRLIPKEPVKVGLFIWSSYSFIKDGVPVIKYFVHIDGGDRCMTEAEILELYDIES